MLSNTNIAPSPPKRIAIRAHETIIDQNQPIDVVIEQIRELEKYPEEVTEFHKIVSENSENKINLLMNRLREVIDKSITNNDLEIVQSLLIKFNTVHLLDDLRLTQQLIAKFSTHNDKQKLYITMLSCVILANNIPVLKYLLNCPKTKFLINWSDELGITALHFATTKTVAKLLIKHGANVDQQCNQGYTALHKAVLRRGKYINQCREARINPRQEVLNTNFKLTKLLIKYQDNFRLVSKLNKTSMDLIEDQYSEQKIMELLNDKKPSNSNKLPDGTKKSAPSALDTLNTIRNTVLNIGVNVIKPSINEFQEKTKQTLQGLVTSRLSSDKHSHPGCSNFHSVTTELDISSIGYYYLYKIAELLKYLMGNPAFIQGLRSMNNGDKTQRKINQAANLSPRSKKIKEYLQRKKAFEDVNENLLTEMITIESEKLEEASKEVLSWITGKQKIDNKTFVNFCSKRAIYAINFLIIRDILDLDEYTKSVNEDLLEASHKGFFQIVQIILKQEWANQNQQGNMGETALHKAAKAGHDDIISLLMKNNANLNLANIHGKTTLHLALENSQTGSAKLLLKNDKIRIDAIDEDGNAPMHVAAIMGNIEIFKLLREKGAHINLPNGNGGTLVHLAIKHNQLEFAKSLLEEDGIKIHATDQNGNAPMHVAAIMGNIEIFKQLREKGAYINLPNGNGETLLHLAIKHNQLEFAKSLFKENGIKIYSTNKDGNAPMHVAAIMGNIEIFKHLIEKGFHINHPNQENKTALHLAIENQKNEFVKFLLSNQKVRRDLIDDEGHTPLIKAIFLGEFEIVKLFSVRDLVINLCGDSDKNALHISRKKGYSEITNHITEIINKEIKSQNHKLLITKIVCIVSGTIFISLLVVSSLGKIPKPYGEIISMFTFTVFFIPSIIYHITISDQKINNSLLEAPTTTPANPTKIASNITT